jgi:hypothetical protein
MGHHAWWHDSATEQIDISDFNGIETKGLPVCHRHMVPSDPYGIHGVMALWPRTQGVISEIMAMTSSEFLHLGMSKNLLSGLSLDIDVKTRPVL